MPSLSSRSLFEELCKFIDFPKTGVREVEIRLVVDETATVKITYIPSMKDAGEPVTKHYMLEEIPDSGLSTAHPLKAPKG